MDELLAARLTMAFSLGFHILFAATGMIMPCFMAVAHFLYLRRGEREYLDLTRMWMKGVAILFAVGAVSGTVLSFELGLLWPGFMKHAGPIIGMPFSWEGTAFFLEAVAIGLFLYGWNRMHPWVHWGSGVLVAVSGFASGIFVVAANSWMNSPSGFEWQDGIATAIDPVKAMFNRAWLHQALHMQVAAFQAVGFAVAGIHAYLLLRRKAMSLNLKALRIALVFAAVSSLIQPLVGHFAAQKVAEYQPVKLAAMEAHFHTEKGAPLYIGGLPDIEKGTVSFGIALPRMLSFLAFNSFDAEVKGLLDFPRELWPPVKITHLSFQLMVGIGSLLALVSGIYLFLCFRRQLPDWFLRLLVWCIPLGFIGIEAGWIVTEVGRQPWIIYGIMKTGEALTPVPGMVYHFLLFMFVYLFLGITTLWLLIRQIRVLQRQHQRGLHD